MDYMSRITERIVLGYEVEGPHTSVFAMFLHLIRQEIPRAVIPVVISIVIMLVGLLTPISLVILAVSSIAAGVLSGLGQHRSCTGQAHDAV